MAKALYRKWRPQDWDQVVAQEHVIQTLHNAVVQDRVAHAYLFAGPRGTGKTTTARLLAKAVNCEAPDRKDRPCNQCEHCKAINAGRFMDLIEIDAASNTSVDDVRELRDKINFSPSQGDFKVYIIDEVHMLSTAAFNALLKTLEEPPTHAIFVLATTEIHKIPATVLSRCQRHEFRRIPIDTIVKLLKEKSQEEGIKVADGVFSIIARQATGSLRDAISLLDQLASTTETISLDITQQTLGTATNMRVVEIIEALIDQDSSKGLSEINGALDGGTDPRQLARQIVTYLRNILLYKMENKDRFEVSEEVELKIFEHAGKLGMPDLLRAIEAFNKATTDEHANWHPGLGLELAFTNYLVKPAEQVYQIKQPTQTAPVQQTPQYQTTPIVDKPSAEKKVSKAKKSPEVETKTAEPEQPVADDVEPEESEVVQPPTNIKKIEGPISISDVHQAWNEIRARVKQHNPRTEGLLNTSKLTGVDGNTLILGFTSDTLKGMMEKEGNLTLTSDILEEVFGQPMLVKCIVTSHQGSALPKNIKIEKDGMVGTATRDLGGKISSAEEIQD
ncbi:MAG: dnaX [Anaerolinea thermophila]|uniref:DNA polymerase III subunit gamma/tau n=1 Tax=Anaerolinea thermophila TaxID=167964 RepID=A0A124FMX7_9CHLR|nr:MAG: dnaX [Anaerolinea thermophila]